MGTTVTTDASDTATDNPGIARRLEAVLDTLNNAMARLQRVQRDMPQGPPNDPAQIAALNQIGAVSGQTTNLATQISQFGSTPP